MAELHRHQQVDAIFTIWDNDHSSYIECEELKLVLGRWKGTSIEQAQEEGTREGVGEGHAVGGDIIN